MTTGLMAEKLIDHENVLGRHESDIITLFKQQGNVGKLADSVHELALSVRDIANKTDEIDARVQLVELDKRQKGFAIWQITTSALLGGGLTYVLMTVLK